MEASKFQFTTPQMLSSSFQVNAEFQRRKRPVELEIKLEVRKERDTENPNARVEMDITVGEDSPDSPFVITVTYGANFKWEDGVYTDEQIESLLSRNAPLLLIGYARPAIAAITNFSKYPAYNLPYIDLTKD